MKNRVVLLAGVVTAAVMLGALPASVRADPVKVLGGGLANFDNVPRLTSYFAVEATVQDNGDTQGDFTCIVTDCCIALGHFDHGTRNDDGSIRLNGTAFLIFVQTGEVIEDLALTVTTWEGGPQVGRFLFHVPGLPDPGDYETVFLGGIQIKR
jgi:hypothetical protein